MARRAPYRPCSRNCPSFRIAEHAPEPTALGIDSRKLGIWLLLGSEAVFFSGLIITYIVFRGKSVSGLTGHQVLDIPLTAVNTFVLICSSLTMVSALAAIRAGVVRRLRFLLVATMVLGLVFLSGQAFEFSSLASHRDPFDPMEIAFKEFGNRYLAGTEHLRRFQRHVDDRQTQLMKDNATSLANLERWQSERDQAADRVTGVEQVVGRCLVENRRDGCVLLPGHARDPIDVRFIFRFHRFSFSAPTSKNGVADIETVTHPTFGGKARTHVVAAVVEVAV